MLPETTERVARASAREINESILRETKDSVARCASGGPAAIQRRLDELDAEWDIERTLEANASSLVLIGLGLGTWVDRRFYLLPAVVAGFLLQHALQGWCPPLPVLRRLGVRTQSEIELERYALKALRGDFEETERFVDGTGTGVREVMQAVQR
ncbi:MAG TPA: hypothetical protein VFZ51_06715 [Woeseiaceae bacterium]